MSETPPRRTPSRAQRRVLEALEQKATDAPWLRDPAEYAAVLVDHADGTGAYVADCEVGGHTEDAQQANAALIAELRNAAPALLDAARRCAKMEEALGQIRDGAPNAVRVARAALRPEPDDE